MLRWQNCHRSAAPPSICSSTTTFPPSVPTTSCSPYLIRCKTNITTSSFSSCNKCIRNRSKFLLTELFFILIHLKPQLNKLKMMLLIIQKMYWESEFVTTREAEQAVNCDLSNQCTNKLLVLINMIKRRFLHHRYKIHFQTKLVAQFLPTNFFFVAIVTKDSKMKIFWRITIVEELESNELSCHWCSQVSPLSQTRGFPPGYSNNLKISKT